MPVKLKKFPILVMGSIFSTTIFAQSSVSISGIVDAGMRYTSNTATGTSKLAMVNGSRTASRLGFQGAEDLGNGLKAIFALEMGIDPDTGTSGDGTRQFNRLSVVGINSQALGQFTFGRQYSMTHEFLAFNGIDSLEVGNYAEWSYYVGTQYAPRYDNSLRYTNKFGGFVVSAMGVIDESQSSGSYPLGATVVYKGANWQFGGAYQEEKPSADTSSKKNQTYTIGGSYNTTDRIQLTSFYMEHQNKFTDQKDHTLAVGFNYQTTGATKILGEILNTKSSYAGQGGRRTAGILTAEYYMSKRTQPYIGIDYTKFSGASKPSNGADSRLGLSVGMRHRF